MDRDVTSPNQEDLREVEQAVMAAHLERVALNVSWLVKLRWAAVLGQLVTVATVFFVMRIDLPLVPLLATIVVGALTNLWLEIWFRVTRRSAEWEAVAHSGELSVGSVMVLDILLLTALLYVSGGPSNPFSLFYLVNVVLGAVVLRPMWGVVLGIIATACYGFLFIRYVPLAALEVGLHADPAAWIQAWRLQLSGLFVAFVTATMIIVYFFTRLASELGTIEAELVNVRQRRSRSERLGAMATLAAGAAHELASPLSTIAVVAKELERELGRASASQVATDDARLIRSEVDRCRRILDQMSVDAGESAGEAPVRFSAAELVADILGGVTGCDRVCVRMSETVGAVGLELPRTAVGQALRGIVKNALDASGSGQQVAVDLDVADGVLRLDVRDEGTGMDSRTLDQVGNPFFTTKEPGVGMGLGVFLARTVIERLGGRMHISSAPGRGTLVEVELPREADSVTRS